MKNLIISTLAGMFMAIMLMTGCSKTNTSNTQVLVGFHFHTFIGGNLVDPFFYPQQAFTDSAGRYEHLQVAQFYVTNIAIHLYGTNTWVPIASDVIEKRIQNEIYPLGNITSAAMDSVRFTVGLGNALNSQQPSAFSLSSPTDSVLATGSQAEALMYGSGMAGMSTMPSGYTFMNIQGYDSTDALPFSYQVGGYGDTVNVVLGYGGGFNFVPVLTGGGLNLIHIIADYGKLLQSIPTINSTNNNSTFYGPNPTPSNTLLNNIKNMFRWECDPPINC
jgi:putative Mn2+ efflux pump MntP